MTRDYWLRSSIFNILFYASTGLACLACLPTLFFPRAALLGVVRVWVWTVYMLEKYVLGLDFEIRGLEYMPAQGSYIVAAKHQSTYETLKLHTLFGDPAIILKQELLKIPLWGQYLKKSDVIAIDRSSPELAITSIQEGARRMKAQDRPIIIFPQGTRVRTDDTAQHKPYKIGVVRLQEATDLPIIPMALNTGYFWPRNGWLKRPGKVIFEFMPPIMPGPERGAVLAKVETAVEGKSQELLAEAQRQSALDEEEQRSRKGFILLMLALFSLCASYTVYWHFVADKVLEQHSIFLTKSDQTGSLNENDLRLIRRTTSGATVEGFPGPLRLKIGKESFETPTGSFQIEDITAASFPFPGLAIDVKTGIVTIHPQNFKDPLLFASLQANFTPRADRIDIAHIFLKRDSFQLLVSGTVTQDSLKRPVLDLTLSIRDYDYLVSYLESQGALDQRMSGFVRAALAGLEQDGVVSMPITTREGKIFAGPFYMGEIPVAGAPAAEAP